MRYYKADVDARLAKDGSGFAYFPRVLVFDNGENAPGHGFSDPLATITPPVYFVEASLATEYANELIESMKRFAASLNESNLHKLTVF